MSIRREDLDHGFGVLDPVGRQVPEASGLDYVGHRLKDSRLHQSPLMVTRLGPRIGKERANPGKSARKPW